MITNAPNRVAGRIDLPAPTPPDMRVRVRRFLAVPTPQLLLSSACAIVLTMKASPTAVLPHRGLAPHQFTPMSGAHQIAAPNRRLRLGAVPWSFQALTSQRSAVGELY